MKIAIIVTIVTIVVVALVIFLVNKQRVEDEFEKLPGPGPVVLSDMGLKGDEDNACRFDGSDLYDKHIYNEDGRLVEFKKFDIEEGDDKRTITELIIPCNTCKDYHYSDDKGETCLVYGQDANDPNICNTDPKESPGTCPF
jgi:hypothetical protein